MKRVVLILLLAAVGLGVWSLSRRRDIVAEAPLPVAAPAVIAEAPVAQAPVPQVEYVEPVPPLLPEITDLDMHDENARLRLITQLGKELTDDDLTQAYAFLRRPTGSDWEAVQKNTLMNVLRGQILAPPGLSAHLAGMVADDALSLTVRDYALQHLVAFYPRAEDSRVVVSTLRSALMEVQTSMAGTALLGLRRLEPIDNSITTEEVREAARSIALNERAGELARVTAIRLCGEYRMEEVLPEVRSIVLHEKNALLRVAAIAALGELGDRKDERMLAPFVEGDYPALKVAAEAALAGLKEKNQS